MKKVLIADDEENIRFSFGSILTDAGFDVINAANLNEAKTIIDTTRLDVAIIDRLLGSDDGMTLVEHINIIQSDCTTILVSAFPTFNSAALGFDYKVFAYLEKPVRKAHLCKIVASAAQNTWKKRITGEYERQLIQAEKMTTLGMLSSGMVHDFNNLFMVIGGYIELATIDLSPKSPVMESLDQMRTMTHRGKELSKKFLSYIKQENINPGPVQIQSLVKKSLEFLRVMVPKSIELTENLGDQKDMVLVHPAQIEQIILNIGMNAVHAMENGTGTIDVCLTSATLDADTVKSLSMDQSNCIKISIRDTGCGMDKEILDQIFNPFFSTRPRGLGTGIGLSLTHKILKDHGGGITAQSQPGKGSLFHIFLPKINESKEQHP